MTIAIGTVTSKSIIVGTDTLWGWNEEFVRDHKTSKFLEVPADYKNKLLISTSGQDKFTQIFEKLIRSDGHLLDFKDRFGLIELVDALQAEVSKHGIGDPENDTLPDHDFGFLIASINTKSLWVLDGDYSINEFDDFVCIGSGTFLGESAMHALSKVGITGKQAVEVAIDTCCQLHPFCGGRIEVREINFGSP